MTSKGEGAKWLGHEYDPGIHSEDGSGDDVGAYCWGHVRSDGHGDCMRPRSEHGPRPSLAPPPREEHGSEAPGWREGFRAGLEAAAAWHEAEAKSWFSQQEVCLPEGDIEQRTRNKALYALGDVQRTYAAAIRELPVPEPL